MKKKFTIILMILTLAITLSCFFGCSSNQGSIFDKNEDFLM